MLICSTQSDMTWFALIRELCFKYDLPHPLNLLHQPPKQGVFKSLIKAKVTDFWQQKLREHAATLTSLRYFQTNFMSLTQPHPMWSAAMDSYSANKIIIVARMLSGRFRCGSLIRHFSPTETGVCKLCEMETEDIEHILLPRCPALLCRRPQLLQYARDRLETSPRCLKIFEKAISDPKFTNTVQFLLDPSVHPEVILANQDDESSYPLILKITSTWCYSLYRLCAKLLENLV